MTDAVRIEAPHFVALVEGDEQGFICRTAPILAWMLRKQWTLEGAKRWATKKGYKWQHVEDQP